MFSSNLLFILLIPFAILAWHRFNLAVLVLLALLPTYLLRTTVFGIPTTWLELAIYVLVLVFCLRRDRRKLDWTWLARYRSWGYLLVMWLVAAILATLIAPDIRLALGILKGWIIDPLLLAVLVIYVARTAEPNWWHRLVISAWLSGLGTSLAAAVLALAQSASRPSGWYDSPNVLAMYLVPLLLVSSLGLGLVRADYLSRGGKVAGWLGVIFMGGIIWWSGSYTGLVSLMAAYFIFALLVLINKNKRVIGLSLSILLTLTGLLLPFILVKYNYWLPWRHYNPEYNLHSGEVRLVLWREAIKVIKTKPVLGLGLGQWQPYFLKTVMPQLPQGRQPGFGVELYYASLFPHNLWLTTWLYLGIFGLISLFGFTLLAFGAAAYSSRLALAGAVVGSILVFGIADTPIFKNDLASLWWVTLATVIVLSAETRFKLA